MSNPDVNLTERRTVLLRTVADGRVQYDPATADFLVDGEPVGNWDRRTLSWLRAMRLIVPDDARVVSPMKVTELGMEHLPPSRSADTDSDLG